MVVVKFILRRVSYKRTANIHILYLIHKDIFPKKKIKAKNMKSF